MKTLGIIAEYNPFHSGHAYQIAKAKEMTGADKVIVVMSGDFVQRGEPAMVDKYARTEMALRQGADLVVEMPSMFVLGDAASFAAAGVAILKALHVDCLCFGSELGVIRPLEEIAEVLAKEPPEFQEALAAELDGGASYPAARATALEKILPGSGEIMGQPNNILGVEYLCEMRRQAAAFSALTIERMGAGYHWNGENQSEVGPKHPSASAIREAIPKSLEITNAKQMLTDETARVLENIDTKVKCELNDFWEIFASRFMVESAEVLAGIYGIKEGLENRIKSEILKASDFGKLDELVGTRRYTKTRLHRIYMQTVLGLYRTEFQESLEGFIKGQASYVRVLGFNEAGSECLRHIKDMRKENAGELGDNWPIITNINKERELLSEKACMILDFDIKAANLFNLVIGRDMYSDSDFVRRPIIIR